MISTSEWHEEQVDDWNTFTSVINQIEARHEGEKHHFFYRGQTNASWELKPSFIREINSTTSIHRNFEIERDAQREFSSQLHLHMDASALPDTNDLLEWWSLMQHYHAPTRLLDWTASPYVAAYFAVESCDDQDGLIWVLNDWALGDRMKEQYSKDWDQWDRSIRSINDWYKLSKSFQPDRFFSLDAEQQVFFFQPKRKTSRVVAQQGWLSTSLNYSCDYESVIGALFYEHRSNNSKTNDKDHWKYWNCKITIPSRMKREFLRRLQIMNITASALFPGIDGLGKSIKEFIKIETHHDKPGSSHSLP